MKQMPTEFKEAYKLAKILRSVCPAVEELVEDPDHFVTSYQMKTCIFWMYFEYVTNGTDMNKNTQQCDMKKVESYTIELFERLSTAYQRQWLEHFWLPHDNLLQDPRYGQFGWCASSYANIMKWLLEPDDVEEPIFLTAADCVPKPSVK